MKDFGSTIEIDQNTFVDCEEAISVYEKNFGNGGGNANVTNTIISGSTIPTAADSYSTISVNYSLSDTSPLPGTGNLLGGPKASKRDRSGDHFLTLRRERRDHVCRNRTRCHDIDRDVTRCELLGQRTGQAE